MAARFTILFLCLTLALIANLCLGETCVDPITALKTAFSGKGELAAVLNEIRIPRLLSAMLTGIYLSLSGYLLQKLSRNYLADPYLTGVSSGAALGVAAALLLGLDLSLVPLIAIIGGISTSTTVIVLSRRSATGHGGTHGLSITRLLLAGIALSAVAQAAINLMMHIFGTQSMSQGLNLWLMGGLSGRTWSELLPPLLYSIPALAVALFSGKQLRLLSLGEETAAALGLNVGRAQLIILAAAVMLTASATSIAGLVGFVGLIAPYLARQIFKGSESVQIVSVLAIGAVLTLFADLAARTLIAAQELPLGSLMAVLGGPFFIYLLSGIDRVSESSEEA